MSLENMTEEQRDRLAAFANKLLSDPETSRASRRLLKAKDPNFSAPDIDLEDALAAANKKNAEEVAKLREELESEKLRTTQQETEAVIRKAGFEPDAIYKIIKEDRVGSIPAAIELARHRAQQKATESHGVDYTDQNMRFSDQFKDIQKNPAAWARKEAHRAIDELKAQRGIH
jgi:hypothetical protein